MVQLAPKLFQGRYSELRVRDALIVLEQGTMDRPENQLSSQNQEDVASDALSALWQQSDHEQVT